ncbi:MAG: chemotaxis protein CheW [Candidatus Zhuqueibacterota bacterium]
MNVNKTKPAAIARPDDDQMLLETILRQRAWNYSQIKTIGKPSPGTIRVVLLLFGDEKYGLEVRYVKEVVPLRQLTPVPCTPDFVTGIINVRGTIISTIDMRRFFNLKTTGLTDLNKVVVIKFGDFEMGILAMDVSEVKNIQLEDLHPAAGCLTEIDPEYIKGVSNKMEVILDLKKLIEEQRFVISEEVE